MRQACRSLKESAARTSRYGGAKGLQDPSGPRLPRSSTRRRWSGPARHPAGRPGRLRLEPGRRRAGAEREQQRPAGPDHELQHCQRRLCCHQAFLRDAIVESPKALAVGRPALFKLNQDFPALRAFAREALPGVKSVNSALDYANRGSGSSEADLQEQAARAGGGPGPTVRDLAALSIDRCRSSSRRAPCPPASTTSSSPGATPRSRTWTAIRPRARSSRSSRGA